MNQRFLAIKTLLMMGAVLTFGGCGGRDSNTDGVNGQDGINGITSLIKQTTLTGGNSQCIKGGLRIDTGADTNDNAELDEAEVLQTSYLCNPSIGNNGKSFNRIATFPVCMQLDSNCDTDDETAAEIVAASTDGMTLIYTDSPANQIGFVDITNPSVPMALGTLAMTGEPTSVAVKGQYALVGVNSSTDFINVSGSLAVVDIATQTLVVSIDVGGQPDSVAVSPDGLYAAIVIENERDEDLESGAPPQAPAGYLMVVKLTGVPDTWATTKVEMTGLADLYPGDPEPEYVDINSDNIAVVTLQENNHIVLVDLATAAITQHFSAGSVNLTQIDTEEEDPARVSLTESQDNVLREPDGVSWINTRYFATADEGDLDGGSRTFTVFNTSGDVVYHSGSNLDHMAVRFGQYPDARSGNKGNEPENIEVAAFAGDRYMFVNSERSSLVFVYDAADPANPIYKQTLPAALAPEGVLAIPSRNLLIAASEADSRADAFRSSLNIYNYTTSTPKFPTLTSMDRVDGTPIPWGALSGLAASRSNPNMLYAVDDSYYQQSRIFSLDVSKSPASIVSEMRLMDSNDVFAAFPVVALTDATVVDDDAARADVFDEADLALIINTDKSINIDPEGIAVASDGGFWVASEGSGTVGDAARPINSLNWIFKTDANGIIEQVFTLPGDVNALQVRFGFEGVTEYNGKVYVAMQRAWNSEAGPRIAVLDPANNAWEFFSYPLDATARGWVGLSDITALGNGEFLVIERDNQAGPDAKIKRLYRFDVTDLADGDTITKILVRDLLMDLKVSGGLVPEKIEGLAVTVEGDVYIINDNDGVDDNSGETQLLNLGGVL